jgi:hypothetical protein
VTSFNLEPCSFCIGEAEVYREGTSRQSCIVRCTECGACLESNENGAGRYWNQRPKEVWYAECLLTTSLDSQVLVRIEKALQSHIELGREVAQMGAQVPDFAHVVKRLLKSVTPFTEKDKDLG